MAIVDGSTSDRLQTTQLLALAGETDSLVTERTLEFWRHQGLLPHPERSGQDGKRPVWTYPPETVDQLRALLHLRQQAKDPNVLRAALWYDGYAIETTRVRSSISAYLRQLRDICEKELAKRAGTSRRPNSTLASHPGRGPSDGRTSSQGVSSPESPSPC